MALEIGERTQALVIGAGPAGLAAAIEAAQCGLDVVLVDENPVPFRIMGDDVPLHYGQGMSGLAGNRNAMMEAMIATEPEIEAAFEAGVDMRLGTSCWAIYRNGEGVGWLPGMVAGLADESRSWLIGAGHVIVAAGRRDMGIGFSGWEKPGVMGATAAVALARRYGALAPRRVVVLGSTHDALLAALDLRQAGIEIAAIVEQAGAALGAAGDIAALRAGGTQILSRHVVREAVGRDGVEAAIVCEVDRLGRATGSGRSIACDGIVLAVGTTPVIDLIDAAGARIAFDPARGGHAPVVDADQRTSVEDIFAIGDAAGIWPAKSRDRGIAEREGRRAVAAIAAGFGLDISIASNGAAPARPGQPGMPASDLLLSDLPTPDLPDFDLSAYRLAWVRASVVEGRGSFHVCQCEEVTAREILEVRPPRYLGWDGEKRNDRSLSALLGQEPPHPDQIKRLTRAGMGSCQGRRCREQVAALLALGAGLPLSAIPLAGYRAPVRPLPLALAGQLPESPEASAHWDTWFGMHSQWRPFWEVPDFHTVAGQKASGHDATGPVASE